VLTQLSKIIWQTTLLWLVYRLGSFAVGLLRISLPGNVAGMLLLFGLLASGVVKPELFAEGSGLLLKHFAFFFIPISVGLMAYGPLIQQRGLRLLLVLAGSAALGMAMTGLAVEGLSRLELPRRRAADALEKLERPEALR
jgi:holin-like protein